MLSVDFCRTRQTIDYQIEQIEIEIVVFDCTKVKFLHILFCI